MDLKKYNSDLVKYYNILLNHGGDNVEDVICGKGKHASSLATFVIVREGLTREERLNLVEEIFNNEVRIANRNGLTSEDVAMIGNCRIVTTKTKYETIFKNWFEELQNILQVISMKIHYIYDVNMSVREFAHKFDEYKNSRKKV